MLGIGQEATHKRACLVALAITVMLAAVAAGTAASALAAGAPETTISAGPSGTYRSGSAQFTLSSVPGSASFECRLDGGSWEACSSTPSFEVANGLHRLEARAVSGGTPDPSPAVRTWWADATLQNGNFETSTAGWSRQGFTVPGWGESGGTLAVMSGGLAGGDKMGRLTSSGSASPTISTSPDPVNATAAGVAYTARGSVRGQTPGRTICLKVREYQPGSGGDTLAGQGQSCVTTNGAWQSFPTLNYTSQQAGSYLDLLVFQTVAGAAGEVIDLDGLSLSDAGSPSVLPVGDVTGDPVLLATADVASCWSAGDEATGRLLDSTAGVIGIAGDTEQNHGEPEEYEGCYEPPWGRHKWRTKPAVGDHEYRTPEAAGYFDYYGSAAGEPGKGWYSYDLANWHIVVLNSNCDQVGGCGPGSEQYEWLQQDLDDNAGDCVGAYFHHPRFSAGATHGSRTNGAPFWELLYEYGAEFVYGGNDHTYQRFAPQDPDGQLDAARGLRQFVVGTGGTQHYPLGPPLANTQVQHSGTFGVLKLTLHPNSYEWSFLPQAGKSFTDSGSTGCSPLTVDNVAPETTIDAGPSGLSASTLASFSFTASEPGSTFECKLDGGAWQSCTSPRALAGLSQGSHTFRVRATDPAGNTDASEAVRGWTVDTVAPDTTITGGPSGPIASTSASLSFAGEPGAQFECKLDDGAWQSCSSPRALTGLSQGDHTFRVRASDAAGNTGPEATRSWTVDTVAPESSIGAGPAGTVASTAAGFSFSSPDPDAQFECRLDGGQWSACSSPRALTGLSQGPHTFRVRAIDPAGNTGPETVRTWTVDTLAPSSSITGGPTGTVASGSASFGLSSSEPGSFECQLDGGPWEACSSPHAVGGLADGSHTLRVRATDAAANTGPEATRTWIVDTVAPDTTITGGPSGPTASTSAGLSFSSEPGAQFECKLDDGAWTSCSSPRALTGLSQGPHTFRVRARDSAGNADPTEAVRSWTVDTVAPDTTITAGPSGPTASTSAGFGFGSNEPGSSFECRLDAGPWQSCESPRALTGLGQGDHTFRVRATDAAGNTEATEAARTWTVDTVTPDTTIDSGPSGAVSSNRAELGFGSSEPGATFECRLDGGAWEPCTAPLVLTGLANGEHTLRVRATDVAGNTDETEATRAWTVDAEPPDTSIASGPAGTVLDTRATFAFAAGEPGATFECRLDGGPWAACVSPHVLTGLSYGTHTFRVRALDALGNADASEAVRTWSVERTPPKLPLPPPKSPPAGEPGPGGGEPPGAALVAARLRADVAGAARALRRAGAAATRKRTRVTLRALMAGRFTVKLTARRGGRLVLLASGTGAARAAGGRTIVLKPARAARRLPARRMRVRLVIEFRDKAGRKVAKGAGFRLSA